MSKTALQPVQPDLYHIPLEDTDLRDANTLLEFPWFEQSRRPSMEVKEFGKEGSDLFIRVSPGARGMATEFDRDVLVYCISQLVREANDAEKQNPTKPLTGKKADKTAAPLAVADQNSIKVRLEDGRLTMSIIAYDVLTTAMRGTGKRAYEQLKDALFRLRSTTIETNMIVGGHRETRGFGWLNDYRIVEEEGAGGVLRMKRIEVTLSRWVLAAISQDRSVLAINPCYFELESGLERRLYQLARKHCGKQVSFTISLGRLAEKVGTRRPVRLFKSDLAKVIREDNIPDYEYIIGDPNLAQDGAAPARARRGTLDRTQITIRRRTAPHVGERVMRKAARQAQAQLED